MSTVGPQSSQRESARASWALVVEQQSSSSENEYEEGDPWTEWNAHELGGIAGTKFDLVRLIDLDGDGDLTRINTLLVEGEEMQEGYGPYYAMQTLQNNFGMYVDAYVVFDFVAFMAFIDAIGGVTVDVPYVINDQAFPDMNYGYDPLVLSPGEHRPFR